MYNKKSSKNYKKNIADISGNSDYDAAQSEWGGSWRLPTKEEMFELVNLCQWNWTTLNGYNGFNVIGLNNKSIFLPVSGYCYGNEFSFQGEFGYYWTSSSYNDKRSSYYLNLNEGFHNILLKERYYGFSIRPVTD